MAIAVAEGVIQHVNLQDIQIDRTYQRPLNRLRVKQMATNFNPAGIGKIAVNRRPDGSLWAIDGQHRLATLIKVGLPSLDVEMFQLPTVKDEASLYVIRNSVNKKPEAVDLFRAKLVMEEARQMDIKLIVEDEGFVLLLDQRTLGGRARKYIPNGIIAVNALEDIYGNGNEMQLRLVLKIVKAVWPDEFEALEAKALLGISTFCKHYNGQFEIADLTKKLQSVSILKLIRNAQANATSGLGSAPFLFAHELVAAYNNGKRTKRLDPEVLLRATKK